MLTVKELPTCNTSGRYQGMYIAYDSAMHIRQPTLIFKPMGDITRNPKHGYRCPSFYIQMCIMSKKHSQQCLNSLETASLPHNWLNVFGIKIVNNWWIHHACLWPDHQLSATWVSNTFSLLTIVRFHLPLPTNPWPPQLWNPIPTQSKFQSNWLSCFGLEPWFSSSI